MKTHILTIILVTVASTSTVSAQYVADSRSGRLDQMVFRRAVVKIDDVTDRTSGTGFLIREDSKCRKHILTNAHVAERGHQFAIDLFPHGSMDVDTGIELLALDSKRDLALLRLRTLKGTGFLPIRRRKHRILNDEPALLIGFPGEKLKLEKIGLVEPSIRTNGFDGRFCRIEKRFGAGGSGSPVIAYEDERFHVIGVYQGYTTTRGVACYQIEEFLDENGYSSLIDDKPSDEEMMTLFTAALSVFFEELER